MLKKTLFVCFALLSLCAYVRAQGGYSSASMGLSREASGLGIIPPPDAIRVEEYLNYHKHQLSMPEKGQAARMDLRWGCDKINSFSSEAVLQIGFTTLPQNADNSVIPPLNIGLVVDKSGSMNDFRKIHKVREALLSFLEGLRPDDIFSISVFDNDSQVIFPSQKVGNKNTARIAIESIAANGATNINSGLLDGLKQVEKKLDPKYTNAVILLTDGIANQGEADPEKILQNAAQYLDKGIILSTIGVGRDLNHGMLRNLAKKGKGQVHFLADSADVKKVFVQELEALLSPKARNVSLSIENSTDLSIQDIYGYEPRIDQNRVTFELDNMNAGLTQVLLIKYSLANNLSNPPVSIPVTVTWSYDDITQSGKKITEKRELLLHYAPQEGRKLNMLLDPEVRKNYSIALMAQSIKQMAKMHYEGKTEQAEDCIDITIGQIKSLFPAYRDPDLTRMLHIIERYASAFDQYRMTKPLD
ncbi:MAG: VWA domain-containing protein [Cytophagales bacterium]|nr:MAG: VWA domain-containing protein [Cytophagales bacterium]TAF61878.1 MAG: VWA domain-containing protein [Cytophagales bacterium]